MKHWWEDDPVTSALQNSTIMASSAGRLPPFGGESPPIPEQPAGTAPLPANKYFCEVT